MTVFYLRCQVLNDKKDRKELKLLAQAIPLRDFQVIMVLTDAVHFHAPRTILNHSIFYLDFQGLADFCR
jgi:hypothetical protein